jgi:hypothetical protein
MPKVSAGLILVFGLMLVPAARADEEFDALTKDFEQAQSQWYEQMRSFSAKGKAAGADSQPAEAGESEPAEMPPHPAARFMPRFRAYAEKHSGKSEAVPALSWMIAAGGMPSDEDGQASTPVEWALQQLATHHVADPAIKGIFGDLRFVMVRDTAPLLEFYERVIKENPNTDAKAGAMFNLASVLYHGPAFGERDAADDGQRVAEKKRGEELFRRLIKEFPASDPAPEARACIFEIDHLQIGMTAPEIEGTDPDDKPLKLAQFRGKVVVAYFWGFW